MMYQCIANIKTNYFNTRNDECWTSRILILEEKNLDLLYERIAEARIKWTQEGEIDEDGEIYSYSDKSNISFGPIRETSVGFERDQEKIASTPQWKEHLKRVAAQEALRQDYKLRKEQEETEEKERRAAAQRAYDLEAYERIRKELESSQQAGKGI